MSIRRLTEQDAAALWELRETPVAAYAERLCRGGDESPVFAAWSGGRMIGMGGLFVETVGKRRSARIRGMLPAALLGHARTLTGLEDVRLEVAATQPAARRLYLSCGFRASGAGPHGAEELAQPLARRVVL